MKGFVAFLYDPLDERALSLAMSARDALDRTFDRRCDLGPGFQVWASTDLDLTTIPNGVCVGQVFGRETSDGLPRPEEAANQLCRRAWGRYAALWRDGSVLRSPLGFLDVFTWRREGLQVVASTAPPCLDASLPPGTRIDMSAIARFLRREPQGFGLCPLTGVETVAAGELWREGRRRQMWRWQSFCGRKQAAAIDARPGPLRDVIDACVATWAARFPDMGCEVSGGLDSSILAASLMRAGAKPRLWVNYHEATRGGDERRYVADLARSLGIDVTYVAKRSEVFDIDALEAAARGLRPASAGLDASSDRDLADRLAEAGAAAVFGGQGGDAIFFQMPTPLIGADPLFGVGRADIFALWADLARWQGSTVWSMAAAAATSRLRLGGAMRDSGPPLSPHVRRWRPPAADHAAPAKCLQGEALHNSQAFFGPCRRAEGAALIHPLLSQPIVEHCLSIPASVLTGGVRDRLLVRNSYAALLPPSIAQRRSKGLLSSYYARHVAANAAVIGSYLSDGRLAALGLIDADAVQVMLQPNQMIQRTDLSVLLTLALMEAWIRVWERRLAARI